jgi:hypothetical protein
LSFRASARFATFWGLVSGLRALHSGIVGDYVAWPTAGVAMR